MCACMLITKANTIIILWQNIYKQFYRQKTIYRIVLFMLTWSNIERNTVATVKENMPLCECLCCCCCWWLLLYLLTLIDRHSVYAIEKCGLYPSEINSVECSSNHSCDSKLNLFDPFSLENSTYLLLRLLLQQRQRRRQTSNQLDEYVAYTKMNEIWKETQEEKTLPEALSQNTIINKYIPLYK